MPDREQISEREIVSLAQRGDSEARKILYSQNVRYLSAICYRYVPDVETAKDILQDAFVKIYKSLDSFSFRGNGSLRAWMSRIVVNEALKYLRDKAKTEIVHASDYLPDVPDTSYSDDESLASAVPPEKIHEFIGELPAGYRMVFNMYLFDNYSHKEIAKILGISEMTSASQFHRARKLLASKIRDYIAAHADNPKYPGNVKNGADINLSTMSYYSTEYNRSVDSRGDRIAHGNVESSERERDARAGNGEKTDRSEKFGNGENPEDVSYGK